MGDKSTIEWTDATWNPVTGCSKVSPGCAHCYAETLAPRLHAMGREGYTDLPWTPANAAENVILHPGRLDQPIRWRKPRMVFVNSMSDLFHEEIPDEFIAKVYETMLATPQHTYQVLTKRPERMRDFHRHHKLAGWRSPYEIQNLWVGVSIENRRYVHRADVLRETPAAVRFISAEPLLGPLIARFDPDGGLGEYVWSDGSVHEGGDDPSLDLSGIDWLIVGGESGPKHRSMRVEWVRDLRDYCHHSRHLYDPTRDQRGPGTAFFFKQWGGRTPKAGGRELDGRTWDEMPEVASA